MIIPSQGNECCLVTVKSVNKGAIYFILKCLYETSIIHGQTYSLALNEMGEMN